jgi:hypothetical protein
VPLTKGLVSRVKFKLDDAENVFLEKVLKT